LPPCVKGVIAQMSKSDRDSVSRSTPECTLATGALNNMVHFASLRRAAAHNHVGTKFLESARPTGRMRRRRGGAETKQTE